MTREVIRHHQTPTPNPSPQGGGEWMIAGLTVFLHHLLDRSEDRTAFRVEHLDPHAVTEAQEGRHRFASADRLDHAQFGDAGITAAALIDRSAFAAVLALVRHGARADDATGAERPRLRGMGDELAEIEGHVLAGI